MEENERAVAAMRQFLEALGLDLQALGMEKTPHRVAQAFADFFSGLKENPDDEWQDPIATQTDGLVVVRNIRFHSMCEHHLLPFFGSVHVAYYPKKGDHCRLRPFRPRRRYPGSAASAPGTDD